MELLMLDTILHHPRKLWLRRALFQVHLWLGILLALYVIVIGLSGSLLVFENQIRLASLPHGPVNPSHVAPISAVVANARERYPDLRLTYVAPPQRTNPWWALYLEDAHGKTQIVYADAASGTTRLVHHKLWIDYVLDLHVYLLMGQTGYVINCLAGTGMLLLALTGVVLWWPGVKLWRRAFWVSFRRRWQRINYDTHSAIGIWALLIISWWGLTAVYFLSPAKFMATVNAVSPLIGMKPPDSPEPPASEAVVRLEDILARQQTISPGYLDGVSLPEKPGGKVIVYVDRLKPADFSHRDVDTFDGHTGKLLSVWHYGENKSLGDWILWLIYPLHFGTLWGLPVQILWSLLGCAVAVLSVTGLLMYWNRYLRTRWRSLF